MHWETVLSMHSQKHYAAVLGLYEMSIYQLTYVHLASEFTYFSTRSCFMNEIISDLVS